MWLPPGSWFKARTPASHAPADQPVAPPVLCEQKGHPTSASRTCGSSEPEPGTPAASATADSSLFVACHPGFGALPEYLLLVVKNPPANAGDIRDVGSIPGLGRSLGGEPGNPLQYSCLENAMDR